jgi:hypothetical protein
MLTAFRDTVLTARLQFDDAPSSPGHRIVTAAQRTPVSLPLNEP